jgi:hypothetical protein
MYAPEVTARAVAAARERIGFDLEYHSQDYITAARSVLDDLVDLDRGGLKRNLAPDEQRFVINERTLCALDARYYQCQYAYIVNWQKQPELFKPNVAQRMMLDIWADLERETRAIHLLQLKARRLGVSTLSELEVARRVQFHPYTNAVVASADPTKSVLMAEMIDFCWEQMPWWLMPKASKIQNQMPVEFDEIHTAITIQAGNQFNGVARGATPNVYHVSEIAEWVDAEQLIDGALLRAIIDTANVFGIIEGTGEGRGNYLHKTWNLITKEWPLGRSRQMPVFLPWYVGTDIYPSPAERRARPIPQDWQPSDRTIRQAERARDYVRTNPLLLKHLAKGDAGWKMPREQMWYHEVEYESAKAKKTLNIFLAEMASDAFDAFQSSNIPVIDQETLQSYTARTRQPIAVYTIIGDTIPPALVAPKNQWLRGPDAPPPITIRVSTLLPRCPLTFQLIPVRFEGYSAFDPSLKLLIWEGPQADQTYGLGVDTSEGLGLDNSVVQVLRKPNANTCAAQVAEWVSPNVKALQLWPMVLAIGCFYSVPTGATGQRAQSRLAIECRGTGEACQYELQKRGWRNFHPWKRYDNKVPTKDADAHKFGIYTNVWFRPQMIDMLLTHLDEEAIDLPSPYLIEELEDFEKDEHVQKAKAAYGSKDDRIMAIGFPLFSLLVGEPPSKQYARRRVEFQPGGEVEETAEYPVWQPPEQSFDGGFRPVQQILSGRQGRANGLHRFINRQMPKGFR